MMNSKLPFAQIVHAMAGRTRLRIESRRGDDAFFASIATGLSTLQGISHVDVRPLTGGVLIQHHLPLAQVAEAAARARLFTLGSSDTERSHRRTAVPDPRAIIAIGLGASALLQLMRGRILPPAITLALYAATISRLLRDGPESDEP
jgi:hypothetical protein